MEVIGRTYRKRREDEESFKFLGKNWKKSQKPPKHKCSVTFGGQNVTQIFAEQKIPNRQRKTIPNIQGAEGKTEHMPLVKNAEYTSFQRFCRTYYSQSMPKLSPLGNCRTCQPRSFAEQMTMQLYHHSTLLTPSLYKYQGTSHINGDRKIDQEWKRCQNLCIFLYINNQKHCTCNQKSIYNESNQSGCRP